MFFNGTFWLVKDTSKTVTTNKTRNQKSLQLQGSQQQQPSYTFLVTTKFWSVKIHIVHSRSLHQLGSLVCSLLPFHWNIKISWVRSVEDHAYVTIAKVGLWLFIIYRSVSVYYIRLSSGSAIYFSLFQSKIHF